MQPSVETGGIHADAAALADDAALACRRANAISISPGYRRVVDHPGGRPRPAVRGRTAGMVPGRRELPGLPGVAALAGRVCLPRLRPPRRLTAGRWSVRVRRLRPPNVGDRRNDLRPYAHSAVRSAGLSRAGRAGPAVPGAPRQSPTLPSSADGGAEQVSDAIGEGQAGGAPDDHPHHRAAGVAAADAGADRAGDRQRGQYRDERDRHPPRGGQ